MKMLICLSVFVVLLTHFSFSQKNQLRTLNEVVFSFYKPWDEVKLKSKIPANLLKNDIDLFVKTIEEIGVNPYLNFSKDTFYLEIELLKRKMDRPLTRSEFLKLFVPIVNDLKLSHTLIKPDYWVYKNIFDKTGGKYFPVRVKIEDNHLLVDRDYSNLHLIEGDEIISINTVKSIIIIDSLLRYSLSSTQQSKIIDVQEDFSFLLWWVYDFSDTFKIETSKACYSIKGITSAELEKLRNDNSVRQTNKEYKQYEYQQIDSETSKIIFRDFGIKDTITYNHFLDSAFIQIRNKAIHNLIIDVRGNAGGNDKSIDVVKYLCDKPFKASSKVYYKKSKIAQNFFLLFLYPEDRDNPAMLKTINDCFGSCQAEHHYNEYYECGDKIYYPKPDSIRFKGNLFVLSDYKTVSAGVDFVVLIKDYGIGKIIGTETNQSPSNDANGCYFLLPNSNIMAMGATNYTIRPNGDPSTKRGVIPNYEVTQLKADTEKGIDTIMDFTTKLIKKGKN
ncbi:MAG: S41 family peptidase [Bacteroidetes bacterium]|nr:S41 family peptidase [Bacteroidota bacterium]